MKNPDSRQASSGLKQIALLPEPDFNPIYPTPNTLPARCLDLMLDGQTFTHPEFEQLTGSWRLSAVIFTLKELGWPVESFDLSAPSPECSTRTISRYFLPPEVIEYANTFDGISAREGFDGVEAHSMRAEGLL